MKRPGLIVSPSPHWHSGRTVQGMMVDFAIALLPCLLAGWYYFGWNAVRVALLCVVSAVVAEAVWQKALKRPVTVSDGSAVVAGLLLGLILSPEVPGWICVLGSVTAILVGRQLFGGFGSNPFSCVLVGYGFIFISYPHILQSFPMPHPAFGLEPGGYIEYPPMDILKMDGIQVIRDIPWTDLFLGNVPGTAGTVSVLAVLLGGIYLIARRVIRWPIPVFCLAGAWIFAAVCHLIDPSLYASPTFHVLAGWVFLSAFFLATEPGTCPVTFPGMVLYGLGCGCLIIIIRTWGTYMEGAPFAVLLMNGITPLLDRIRPRVIGRVQESA
ncbi:electron transport complex protein RnfD [Desulfacinum hydrothermale DSM 13146]|uniref:Ion-translocating oxidoreductase complex subunit D n=1 Tax=Desulfacinum hydrothermale DSM 13146 TaxID=1121390 RepID=A0A1W1XTR2_9BACT|nr:RnfABCDGE type electron transport complex subunit D [Desulfacinum hydrothermale]SMC27359.1 electron transport complex protein RnfD [Desulfacinum hydrothermale DSM 13146]